MHFYLCFSISSAYPTEISAHKSDFAPRTTPRCLDVLDQRLRFRFVVFQHRKLIMNPGKQPKPLHTPAVIKKRFGNTLAGNAELNLSFLFPYSSKLLLGRDMRFNYSKRMWGIQVSCRSMQPTDERFCSIWKNMLTRNSRRMVDQWVGSYTPILIGRSGHSCRT